MTHLTFTENGKTYRQITKATARKMFCDGKTIYMYPAKLLPFNNPWGNAYDINVKDYVEENDRFTPKQNFELIVNACIYYNCNNVTGRYLRFYAEF